MNTSSLMAARTLVACTCILVFLIICATIGSHFVVATVFAVLATVCNIGAGALYQQYAIYRAALRKFK